MASAILPRITRSRGNRIEIRFLGRKTRGRRRSTRGKYEAPRVFSAETPEQRSSRSQPTDAVSSFLLIPFLKNRRKIDEESTRKNDSGPFTRISFDSARTEPVQGIRTSISPPVKFRSRFKRTRPTLGLLRNSETFPRSRNGDATAEIILEKRGGNGRRHRGHVETRDNSRRGDARPRCSKRDLIIEENSISDVARTFRRARNGALLRFSIAAVQSFQIEAKGV